MPSVYYPAGCEVAIGDHYCNDCDEIEHGKVRSVAFVKKTFSFEDPSDPTEWEEGIQSKDIIIIPKVLGSFNGGEPVTGPGYGDQAERTTGYNFELTYKDPSYAYNSDFYNGIKRSNIYKVAYRTENYIHISDNTVSVTPKAPVGEEVTSDVVYDVLVKFSQGDLPKPVLTPPGIFECFAYEEA